MSGVLVVTSVWIAHFRNRNAVLEDLLIRDMVLTHPMEIGVLVDLVLLASTLITPGTTLWTVDKPLAGLAERFGIGHRPAVN